MKQTVRMPAVAALLLLPLLVASCRRAEVASPSGTLLDYSGCKVSVAAAGGAPLAAPPPAIVPLSESCLSWEFAGNVLKLSHINAAFNCCSQPLLEFQLSDNLIIVREGETIAGCHCLCIRDVGMEIRDLAPGSYRVVVVGLYEQNQAPLDFSIDLAAEPSGQFCAARSGYPWGSAN